MFKSDEKMMGECEIRVWAFALIPLGVTLTFQQHAQSSLHLAFLLVIFGSKGYFLHNIIIFPVDKVLLLFDK